MNERGVMDIVSEIKALKAAAKPADGWSLSDFRADVSEVISDKRDLINIVQSFSGAEEQKKQLEQALANQRKEIDRLIALERDRSQAANSFNDILAWWDQNYNIISDAKKALELNQRIVDEAARITREATTARQEMQEAKNTAIQTVNQSVQQGSQTMLSSAELVANKSKEALETATASINSTAQNSTEAITAAKKAAEAEVTKATDLVRQAAQAVSQAKTEAVKAAAAEVNKANGTLDQIKKAQAQVQSVVDNAKQAISGDITALVDGAPDNSNTLNKLASRINSLSSDVGGKLSVGEVAVNADRNRVVRRDGNGAVLVPSGYTSPNAAVAYSDMQNLRTTLESQISSHQPAAYHQADDYWVWSRYGRLVIGSGQVNPNGFYDLFNNKRYVPNWAKPSSRTVIYSMGSSKVYLETDGSFRGNLDGVKSATVTYLVA